MVDKIFEKTASSQDADWFIEMCALCVTNKAQFTIRVKSIGTAEQSITLMTSIEGVGFTRPRY